MLLRQFITLGTMLKVLVAVATVLVGIGAYEVTQLDKLRDETKALQTSVMTVQTKVENVDGQLKDLQGRVNKTGDLVTDFLSTAYKEGSAKTPVKQSDPATKNTKGAP